MKPQGQQVDHLQQWSMEWVIKIYCRLDNQVQKSRRFGGFFVPLMVMKEFFIP
ncbi:hypothetical protein [Paenibacillus sp. 22594]|uniref:hypothetical protein n=1 Tax=Paenibacillus sp. 22594 TaxID=3453947 RepID=UPI003F876EDB